VNEYSIGADTVNGLVSNWHNGQTAGNPVTSIAFCPKITWDENGKEWLPGSLSVAFPFAKVRLRNQGEGQRTIFWTQVTASFKSFERRNRLFRDIVVIPSTRE